MKQKQTLVFLLFALFSMSSFAQENNSGTLTGNVSLMWQQYNEDSIIGATVPEEKAAMNAFGNLIYTRGNFQAGMRFESYTPAINGFPTGFEGSGVGYRFARYNHQNFDITIGNFYDQFGSGLLYRTYEDRNLGVDNAMDGFRMIYKPFDGLTLKGIYGRQRVAFKDGLVNGDGLVRAVDAEVSLNDLLAEKMADKDIHVTLGGSFVSKYQDGDAIEKDTLFLRLPNNVGGYAGRAEVLYKGWSLYGEYVQKVNDPSADNGFIYKNGEGIFMEAGYSTKGLGIIGGFKMVDNMSYRSDRDMILLQAPINFIPAITKTHTYNLAATLYPYATLINGESSYMGEVSYKFQKETPLGGKYGTKVTVNYAAASSLDTTQLKGTDGVVYGYERNSLFFGDEKYVRDLNIEIEKKLTSKLKMKYTYYNFEFNTAATVVTSDFLGMVFADIHVLELNKKLKKKKHSIRTEFQALFTDQDKKDWATVLAEYNWSPHWSFSILDQYNFGNDDADQRVHYLYGSVTYINGSNRIAVGYGKRREGIFCVGGVCRAVPASNGLEIVVTSSF